jgi:hypothetical protein
MKTKKQTLLALVISVIMLTALPAPASFIDSVNADKTPFPGEMMGVGEIGWVYTPQFSYTLTGIKSYFGDPTAPVFDPVFTVKFEIYDDVPINGGVLLRSVTFLVKSWPAGGAFSPLDISAGDDYFVGFRYFHPFYDNNVALCNFTGSGVSLPAYYGTYNSGTYSTATNNNNYIHPILLFEGTPEPATLLLLAFGGLMLRRKR